MPYPQRPPTTAVPSSKLPSQRKPDPVPAYSGPTPPASPPTAAQSGAPSLPPVQNGPVFPDSSFVQPVSFNGGSFNPTTAPFGFDLATPGTYEQLWNNNQNRWLDTPQLDWANSLLPQFQDPWTGEQTNQDLLGTIANPGAGQQYWNGIKGKANTAAENALAAGYQGPNNAQIAFNMTGSRIPNSFQPQFDAYYDRMHDKAMSDVNSQSAARGAYGSNAALNNSIGAGLDIEAQRAKAATDFMFKDSENQRAWLDSLGTQGRNADLSGIDIFGANEAAARYGLDKTKTLGDLAFKAEDTEFDKNKEKGRMAFDIDDHKRSRLESGIESATNLDDSYAKRLDAYFGAGKVAQDAFENRTNSLYGRVEDFSNDVKDFITANTDRIINGDREAVEAEIEAQLAKAADERGWSQYETERIRRDIKDGIEAASKGKEAGLFG